MKKAKPAVEVKIAAKTHRSLSVPLLRIFLACEVTAVLYLGSHNRAAYTEGRRVGATRYTGTPTCTLAQIYLRSN